jgi:TldD protein
MKQLLGDVLDLLRAQGASYGDVRVVRKTAETLEAKDGHPVSCLASTSAGFGVRVIADGAWGFAASSRLERDEMLRVAAEAVAVARASARFKTHDVVLAPQEPVVGSWAGPAAEDPFAVPLEERMDLLVRASAELKREKGVQVGEGFLQFWLTEKTFASTEGAYVEQKITESGGGIVATAVSAGDIQTRSYPNSFRGNFATAGYEFVRALDLLAHAPRVAAEAVELLTAVPCPTLETTLVIGGSQLALQIHESCGHPIELDRVLGSEASYAGMSFLTLEKRGNFRYGSPLVNVVADATVPGGLGSFGYDDEGVPARRTAIVKEGIFVDYLTNRETAPVLGPDTRSNGTARAQSWSNIPIIRMTNINLLPGASSLAEMLATTADGLFLDTNRSWSIDDRRINFQFTAEYGRLIKDGKLGAVVKNPTYTGKTPAFWGSCDAIAGESEWQMWGTPNCGKGQPGQSAHVGHGCAPARFRKVKIQGTT